MSRLVLSALWAGPPKNMGSIHCRVRDSVLSETVQLILRPTQFLPLNLSGVILLLFSQGVVQPQHEAGHSPPSSGEVKNPEDSLSNTNKRTAC